MDSNFRRTQSLRYPQGKGSLSMNGFSRKGSKAFRSKSSRNKHGADQTALSRMTLNQLQALATSWRLLKPQAPSLMRKIFAELELVSNKVKDIFYKAALVECFVNKEPGTAATLDDHCKHLVKFFDDLITNIECEAEAIAMIKRVGQCHAILNQSCAFQADIWEHLGEIAMEKICSTDAVQKTREAGRAWRTLIAFVTDELRSSFDGEAKVYSRRPSCEQPDLEPENLDVLKKLQELRMEYNSTVPVGQCPMEH
ncbi:Protein GLB-9 [Aphelenchoides avenae]|nr:Protein GLB-9 [Aphelenchus avenae]